MLLTSDSGGEMMLGGKLPRVVAFFILTIWIFPNHPQGLSPLQAHRKENGPVSSTLE